MSARVLHLAEPPARYQVRPPLVVDCSVLAAALFQEDSQHAAQQRLGRHELHAPFLIESELASVALKKWRLGFEQVARSGLSRLAEIILDLHRVETVAVTELARELDLSAYDASYLWLAAEMRAPLATFDERLASAAREHLSRLA